MSLTPDSDERDEPLAPRDRFVAAYHSALLAGAPADALSRDADAADPAAAPQRRLAERVLQGLIKAREAFPRGAGVAGSSANGAGAPSDAFGELLSGPAVKRIGRFEIERELGRGGLGVVFLARDPLLKRFVALKVPRPEVLLTVDGTARFGREAEIAARLTHPNLVPVFELGEAGAVAYIASAYCPGPTLAAYLRQREAPLAPRDAALLTAQLADALHYAHQNGVLHRDIKPGNILLEPRPGEAEGAAAEHDELPWTPKLVDFGLAKFEGAGGQTRTGAVLGTPGYMAPEQIDTRRSAVGRATDVYGLGLVLYESLTGAAAFDSPSIVEAYHRIISVDPLKPSNLVGDLTRDLEAICLKCLEKNPARRYATAEELAVDLRRYLAGEPTIARPLRPEQRFWRWIRRHPTAAALTIISAAAATVVVLGSLWYSARLREALQVARNNELKLTQALFPADMRRSQVLLGLGRQNEAAELLRSYENDAQFKNNFGRKLLRRFANRDPQVLVGGEGASYSVAFSPDSRLLASAGADRLVHVWHVESGATAATLRGHTDDINAVAFAPGGAWLASTSDDGTIRRWDVTTGALLDTWQEGDHRFHALAISSDGKILVAGIHGKVILWDWAAGETLRTTVAPDVHDAAFDATGRPLVVCTEENSVVMLSRDLQQVELRRAFMAEPFTASCSPTAPDVVVAFRDGAMKCISLESRGDIWSVRAHHDEVASVRHSADGRFLVTCGRDGTVCLWSASDGAHLDTWSSESPYAWSVALRPDGQRLAAAGSDGRISVWDLSFPHGTPVARSDVGMQGLGLELRLLEDASRLIVAMRSGQIAVLDVASGQTLNQFQSSHEFIDSADWNDFPWELQCSPDGRYFAAGGPNTTTEIWDIAASPPRRVVELGAETVFVDFHVDGQAASAIDGGQPTIVVDLTTGQRVGMDSNQLPALTNACGAPGSDALAMSNESTLTIQSGNPPQTRSMTVPPGAHPMAFSKSSRWLAIRDLRSLLLVDVPGARVDRKLEFDARVQCVAFSPDERLLAALLINGAVVLVDLVSDQELCRFEGHAPPGVLGFTPDGRRLVVGSTNPLTNIVNVTIYSAD